MQKQVRKQISKAATTRLCIKASVKCYLTVKRVPDLLSFAQQKFVMYITQLRYPSVNARVSVSFRSVSDILQTTTVKG